MEMPIFSKDTTLHRFLSPVSAIEPVGDMSKIEIRLIEQRDDPAIASIIREVMTEFGAVGEGYSIVDAEVDAMTAAYAGANAAYFVASLDDVVVGGAGIGPLEGGPAGVCELRKMYLREHTRGHGLGRQLMEHSLAAARKAGYELCYLETLEHMSDARRLYELNGFVPLNEPLGNTGHCRCNGWFIKEL
jgi:putative acetyltransferase